MGVEEQYKSSLFWRRGAKGDGTLFTGRDKKQGGR